MIGVLTDIFLVKYSFVLYALSGLLSLLVYLPYQGLITMNLDKIDKIAGILNIVIEKITPENNFAKYKVERLTEYLILSLVLKI